MTQNIDKLLSKVLVDRGLIEQGQLDDAVKSAKKTDRPLHEPLLEEGLVSEDKLLSVLAKEMKLSFVDLKDVTIDKAVIEKVPLKIASYYKFMPISIEKRLLTVAVAYPIDVKTQDELRTHLGYDIEMVLAVSSDISDLLKTHYGLAAATIDKIVSRAPQQQKIKERQEESEIEDIEKLAEEESVTKLVNQIILEAYKRRATDIHIEPYRGKVRLRYRIDGVLHNAPVPPEITHFYSSILSRMKIMSNLNIIERRLPQDGRSTVKIQNQKLDLRISSVPTPYAESLVIRLLPTTMLFDLQKLGLHKSDLGKFTKLIKKPHGIIFVTGPTGSGKSTTLYTCLSQLNTDKTKIVTIEDPIEYELEGATQMQVLPEIGLDFAMGLRSMLRHDPDIMMIGEVRDRETAEIAIRVALTGHLVFSTLHTNDAVSGIVRLVDIGIEPYLVATSVEAFIAQRLVRSICQHCKIEDRDQPQEVRDWIVRDLHLQSLDQVKLYKGEGCKKCNSTGYFGRTAIYEILLINDTIKELIVRNASSSDIKNVAIKQGMHTLRQDGWRKVAEGITTPEEVMKLTDLEEDDPQGSLLPSKVRDDKRKVHKINEIAKKEHTGESRRIYTRLNTKVNVNYKVINTKGKVLKQKESKEQYSITEGISAGGLQFISNEAVSLGLILELKIDLPDAGSSIVCLAKVLRVELKDEEGGVKKGFYISVCFLDISGAERLRLDKYVEEELS